MNQTLTHKKGRPEIYADAAILCSLILKSVYHLTYRSLQGFTESLLVLLGLKLPTPSYTQVCRRTRKVTVPKLSKKKATDVVVDGSGLKIYGEGEWLG